MFGLKKKVIKPNNKLQLTENKAFWTFISKMNIKSQNLSRKCLYTISINEYL